MGLHGFLVVGSFWRGAIGSLRGPGGRWVPSWVPWDPSLLVCIVLYVMGVVPRFIGRVPA